MKPSSGRRNYFLWPIQDVPCQILPISETASKNSSARMTANERDQSAREPTPVVVTSWKVLGRLMRERRGTVAIMFAFLSPILIGSMGVGFETSYWYVAQLNQQNAADAAAIAAATNAQASYAT